MNLESRFERDLKRLQIAAAADNPDTMTRQIRLTAAALSLARSLRRLARTRPDVAEAAPGLRRLARADILSLPAAQPGEQMKLL